MYLHDITCFPPSAIANLNGVDLYGKSIHVTLSKHPQVQMPQAGSNVSTHQVTVPTTPVHNNCAWCTAAVSVCCHLSVVILSMLSLLYRRMVLLKTTQTLPCTDSRYIYLYMLGKFTIQHHFWFDCIHVIIFLSRNQAQRTIRTSSHLVPLSISLTYRTSLHSTIVHTVFTMYVVPPTQWWCDWRPHHYTVHSNWRSSQEVQVLPVSDVCYTCVVMWLSLLSLKFQKRPQDGTNRVGFNRRSDRCSNCK